MTDADGNYSDVNALFQSFSLQERVSELGFDWPDVQGVVDKLAEELEELREALKSGNDGAIEHELGDIFLAAVNICRFTQHDPNVLLMKANKRFKNRFRKLEEVVARSGKTIAACSLEELDQIWLEVKNGADKELRETP